MNWRIYLFMYKKLTEYVYKNNKALEFTLNLC